MTIHSWRHSLCSLRLFLSLDEIFNLLILFDHLTKSVPLLFKLLLLSFGLFLKLYHFLFSLFSLLVSFISSRDYLKHFILLLFKFWFKFFVYVIKDYSFSSKSINLFSQVFVLSNSLIILLQLLVKLIFEPFYSPSNILVWLFLALIILDCFSLELNLFLNIFDFSV